jgi:hypothetical protein
MDVTSPANDFRPLQIANPRESNEKNSEISRNRKMFPQAGCMTGLREKTVKKSAEGFDGCFLVVLYVENRV